VSRGIIFNIRISKCTYCNFRINELHSWSFLASINILLTMLLNSKYNFLIKSGNEKLDWQVQLTVIKSTIFWDVALHSLGRISPRICFGGTSSISLHLSGWRVSQVNRQHEAGGQQTNKK
jgi:hypothetical protein